MKYSTGYILRQNGIPQEQKVLCSLNSFNHYPTCPLSTIEKGISRCRKYVIAADVGYSRYARRESEPFDRREDAGKCCAAPRSSSIRRYKELVFPSLDSEEKQQPASIQPGHSNEHSLT